MEDPQSAGLADPWAESVSVIGQSGTPHGGGCGRGPRSVLAATNGKSVLRLQEGKNFPLTSKIFNHFSTMRKNSFKVVRDTPEKMGMTQEQWDSPEEAEKRHNRWNTRRAIRMFQKSKAAAAGMTWEDWQAHKAAIREAKEKTPHAAYLSAYRRTPRGYAKPARIGNVKKIGWPSRKQNQSLAWIAGVISIPKQWILTIGKERKRAFVSPTLVRE